MISQAKILVTGGAGFVGSTLVKKLLENPGNSITVIDNLLSSERISVPDHASVRFILGSAADPATLSQAGSDFDYVFHLATFHGNQSSIARPLDDFENNLKPTLVLLNTFSGNSRLKKFVYSAAGCGIAEKKSTDPVATTELETTAILHDSPYSISKVVGEMYVAFFFKQFGVPAVRARFQNVYGPGEILGAGAWRGTIHTIWRNVIPTFVYKALHFEALPLENAGKNSRDFIFVDDVCEGLIRCATLGEPGESYNIASGKEVFIDDIARLINAECGNTTPPTLLPGRPWDRSIRRYGSTAKSSTALQFNPATDIAEGIQKTVAWSKANLDFIRACMEKHRDAT